MSSDLTDSLLPETDRARADLRLRVDQLKRKLHAVGHRIDLPAQIRRHPWSAVGVAFALGALAGSGARRASSVSAERSLGGAAVGAVFSLALHVVRELALAQLGRTARRWWSEHGGEPFEDPT
jgi:hypothetical protein